MSKTPYVLQALKILGLEEMLKLSEVLHSKKIPLKRVAGEDLVVWEDNEDDTKKENSSQVDAKVLLFPQNPKVDAEPSLEIPERPTLENKTSTESDLYIWHQELGKQLSEKASQQGALKGYGKTNEIYLVKAKDENGQTQVRYASTKGVLVNKKQA